MFWIKNLFQVLTRKKYYSDEDDVTVVQNGNTAQSSTNVETVHVRETSGESSNAKNSPSNSARINGNAQIQGHREVPITSAPGGDNRKLARVLGLLDLTMLGVGATLGVGVYVLAGSVARNQAGPSVVVSFAIAAIASLFSGFCYAEFASRISKSGSAYNYTYLSIGEFAAFIIGWNLVLEFIIGAASEAKAISNQIDSLLGNIHQEAMTRWLPIHSSFLSSYPDLIAPVFVVLITGLLSWGARESTKVNNCLTCLNLGTVGIIVLTGLWRINPANWSIRACDIPPGVRAGSGGFAPFGVAGIVTGAAKCFFGFVGFDGIATTGEETHNPKRNVPLAIILSLLIVFVCYFSIAVVITMIIPYYEQNADAPFPEIFDRLGWPLMKWAVTSGCLVALFTAMFGAFFPLPRILYAMSQDGLLYTPFSYVYPRTQTPLLSTAVSGLITAVMSAIFKLEQLVDMMSIGTLLAYIIVAVCVLLLRYSDDNLSDETERMFSSTDCVYVGTLGNCYQEISGRLANTRSDRLESHKKKTIKVSKDVANVEHRIGPAQTDTDASDSRVWNKTLCGDNPTHLTENIIGDYNQFATITNNVEVLPSVRTGQPKITEKTYGNFTAHGGYDNFKFSNFKQNNYSVESNRVQPNCTDRFRLGKILRNLFNSQNHLSVTKHSQTVSRVCILTLVVLTVAVSFMLNNLISDLESTDELTLVNHAYSRTNRTNLKTNYTLLGTNHTLKGTSYLLSRTLKERESRIPFQRRPIFNSSAEDKRTFLIEKHNTFLEKHDTHNGNKENDDRPLEYSEKQDTFFENKKNHDKLVENNEEHDTLIQNKEIHDIPLGTSEHLDTFLEKHDTFVQNEKESLENRLYSTRFGDFFNSQISSRLFVRPNSFPSNEKVAQSFKRIVYMFVGILYFVVLVILSRQGQNRKRLNFTVPLVPLLPCLTIFMNVYLMINLDLSTWVRFLVWLALGMGIYFSYSIFNSKQKVR